MKERLARLEAVVAKKDAGNTELSSVVKEFQSELDKALDELKLVREKASKEIEQLKAEKTKIQAENAKLQYQVIHLIRAVREADAKLGS
ncbi:hypothetical protein QJS10_CPA16g01135 [Acorus calamus]|uniref:Uncharacterized protein n=1 Tax=Acorus calamus TaxID=4465 RepID=A0AAV9D370_ACOCL|nr:hypothetical protein QJS10_CPA16g01135 [Acorus calamus]